MLGMFGVLALPGLRLRYQQRRKAERRHRQDQYQFLHICDALNPWIHGLLKLIDRISLPLVTLYRRLPLTAHSPRQSGRPPCTRSQTSPCSSSSAGNPGRHVDIVQVIGGGAAVHARNQHHAVRDMIFVELQKHAPHPLPDYAKPMKPVEQACFIALSHPGSLPIEREKLFQRL